MNPFDVASGCGPACVHHPLPPVTRLRAARRAALFARVVLRAARRGPVLADPAVLREHARALLAAAGVEVRHGGAATLTVGREEWERPAAGAIAAQLPAVSVTRRTHRPVGTEATVPGGPVLPTTALSPARTGGVPQPVARPVATPARGGRRSPDALPPGRPGVPPGTLVVANHVSWLDILALLAVEPVTVLAKSEVAGWPVVGALARAAGTRFIDRARPRELPAVVASLTQLLAAGHSVAVFPQATTWCTAADGGFRRAAFQAAVDAGAPVRPVTVTYQQAGADTTVPAFVGTDSFATALRRALTARALQAAVTCHPPLLPGRDGTDRRALAAAAQRVVLGAGGRPRHT